MTLTGEMALFVKCFSLRKVEKMLSLSGIWCAMQQVGEWHRKELLLPSLAALCECQAGKVECVCVYVCVGAVCLIACMSVCIDQRKKTGGVQNIESGLKWQSGYGCVCLSVHKKEGV